MVLLIMFGLEKPINEKITLTVINIIVNGAVYIITKGLLLIPKVIFKTDFLFFRCY